MSLAFCGWVFAADYYVAVTGNDTNSGASDKPFLTIKRGADAAQPGDTVIVGPGRYNEEVGVPRSGAPGKPITFRSSEKGKSIVCASVPLSGFTRAPGLKNVYYAEMSVPKECYGLIDETTLYAYTFLPAPEACDLVPASFCIDRAEKRVYVHTPDSGDPAKHQLELSVFEAGFYISQYLGKATSQKVLKHDIVIDGFTIKNAWRERGAGVVFAHQSLRGILRNCRIENCWIGANASLDADDTLIENCDIINCRDGIRFSYLRRGRAINNRVVRKGDHWPIDPAKPSVGIYPYCWYTDGDNLIWIENNYVEGYGDGIRLKNPAVAVCRNNTFVNCGSGIGWHPGERREFINNLFVDCRIPIEWYTTNKPPKFVSDYNCAFNTRDPASVEKWLVDWRKLSKQEQHGFVAYPRIIGRYPDPMLLAPKSPCIGKGEKGANIGCLAVAPVEQRMPKLIKQLLRSESRKDACQPVGEITCVSAQGDWKAPSSSSEQKEEITLAEPWKRARDAMTSRVFTTNESVKLKISAWGIEGEVAAMQFSNDGHAWSEPTPFAREYQWTLSPEDGKKVVYGRFKDEAGNWSEPATAEIWRKSNPPVLIGAVISRTNRYGVCLAWTASEPCEGVLHYGPTVNCGKTRRAFLYVDAAGKDASAQHVVFLTIPDVSCDTATYYKVELRDMAGNCRTSAPASFNLEGEPREYFVGMTGNDANPGTREKPWQTMSQATRCALPGDTVTVCAGTYAEPLAVTCGGVSDGSRITYRTEGPVTIERAGQWPYGVVIQGLKFVTIAEFEIRGFTGAGIYVFHSSDIIIRGNNIHSGYTERLTLQSPYIGGEGVYAHNSQRVKVEYNRLFWSTHNLIFYFSTDCRADHNTIAGSVYANVNLPGNNPGTVIINNIIVGDGNDQCSFHNGDYEWKSDYNCWIKLPSNKRMISWYKGEIRNEANTLVDFQKAFKDKDVHSIFGDPKFVDPAKGDFRLKEGSPCIKAGENGTDIGAFEAVK